MKKLFKASQKSAAQTSFVLSLKRIPRACLDVTSYSWVIACHTSAAGCAGPPTYPLFSVLYFHDSLYGKCSSWQLFLGRGNGGTGLPQVGTEPTVVS